MIKDKAQQEGGVLMATNVTKHLGQANEKAIRRSGGNGG